MDTIEQNKQTVTAFIDALFTRGDLSAVDTYLAEDFVDHDPPLGAGPDREGMRGAAALFRQACPDWHSDQGFLVGEGDLVVEIFTASGTRHGELMGVAGDGHTVALKGINVFRVRDGRIVERWGRLDELGLLRRLGLVPELAPA
ncbi:ester cyclase [Kitasatospora sp. NPDC094015]|uniref:ester cyclase n=1 Tax=Kitasatospora sp. NPDC094015 TaxID=3155205 RepID=UPI00331D151F